MPITPDQVDAYRRDGCLVDVPALSPAEVTRLLNQLQSTVQAAEAAPGGWVDRHYFPHEEEEHPLLDWFLELATHPAVLDNVAALLGDDLLVRNGDIFLKTGARSERVRWHQDTRRDEVDGMVSAWIALTDVTPTNSPLELVLGSYTQSFELEGGSSLAIAASELPRVEAMPRVANTMKAGRMSLHHLRTVHRSEASEGDFRAAFVVRYMAADTSAKAAEAGQGMLVRGRRHGTAFGLTSTFPVTWISGDRTGAAGNARFAVM